MALKRSLLGVALASFISNAAVSAEPIKIGVIQPLVGNCASWGIPILRGAEIWAKEINESGGIKDHNGQSHQIEVRGYDNACYTAGEELTAARRAILDDGVQFILQTYTPASRQAIAPLVTQNKVLTLSFGGGYLDKKFPYLIGAVTGAPTVFMLLAGQIIASHPNIHRVAIVTPDSSYGLSAKAFYRAGIAPFKDRINIVYDNSYDPNSTDDMFGLATPIAQSKPDLILELGMPPGQQALFIEAMQQLHYRGLFASGGWTMSLIKDRVPADYTNGRLFSAYVADASEPTFNKRLSHFYERYNHDYGNAQWSSWASVGYATMTTLEPGIEKASGVTGADVQHALFESPTVDQPIFGLSTWGGKDIYGTNTQLMTPVPIYSTDSQGKITLSAVVDTQKWWDQHKEAALAELKASGQVNTP